jgi:hypothetical protein
MARRSFPTLELMKTRAYFIAAFMGFPMLGGCALASDAFGQKGFDAGAYGGPLYEPRYCDPSGHLPMSACLMANLNMAEDFLLRAIEAKYGAAHRQQRQALQAKLERVCNVARAAAVKRYKSGELIDFTYWSCLRGEYHRTALELIR